MRKLLYFFLVGPFELLGRFISFIVWDFISINWKYKPRYAAQTNSHQQGGYIQYLLKENGEYKIHENEIHEFYRRQLKKRDSENSRLISQIRLLEFQNRRLRS